MRFQRECETAASIQHPRVVPIYHAGEEDGLLYVTMRYVDGTDLSRALMARGRLEVDDGAADRQAGRGRAAGRARSSGSCTATSSPRTSCSTRDGSALLGDFGLTKHVRRRPAHARGRVRRDARLRRARAVRRRARSTRARTSTRSAACSTRCSAGASRTRPRATRRRCTRTCRRRRRGWTCSPRTSPPMLSRDRRAGDGQGPGGSLPERGGAGRGAAVDVRAADHPGQRRR